MSRGELAVQRARRSFQTGKSKPLEFRLQQLKNLLRFISERRKDIAAAVKKDLGKVSLELFIKKKGNQGHKQCHKRYDNTDPSYRVYMVFPDPN